MKKVPGHKGREAQGAGALCILLGIFFALSSNSRADDVGNAPTSAEMLSTGSVTRIIERHPDRDVFLFTVLPFVSNAVTVSTGTVWDCEMDLLSPAGTTVLLFTNTVVGGSNTVLLLSTGAARRAYLSVKSLAEHTTGSYHVALARLFTDADADGLPDAWELARFASLTNAWTGGDADADGLPDDAEWIAGTNPNDASSALRIQSLQRITNWTHISWTTQPDGLYRVSRAGAPTGAWTVISDLMLAASNVTATSFAWPSNAVFRVEFVY